MFILKSFYEDYPTIYETTLNEYLIPILILLGIVIIIAIIFLVGLMNVFKKANRSGFAAFIPIYNIIVMLEITNKPLWYLVLFFIPILNFIIGGEVLFKIAKSFRKDNSFAIGNIFLPFVFTPILGFDNSEYIGINKEAMTGISIAKDLPIITNEPTEDSYPAQPEKERPKVSISIGGGVYQKQYEDSLIHVPGTQQNNPSDEAAKIEEQMKKIAEENNDKKGADLFKNVKLINNAPEPIVIPSVEESSNIEPYTEIPQINMEALPASSPQVNIELPAAEIPTIIVENKPETPAENTNLEYVSCPQCGSKLKNGSPRCFMCGKQL